MDLKKDRDITLDIIKIMATVFVIKLHSGEGGLFSEVFHYVSGTAIPLYLLVSGALILIKIMWISSTQGKRSLMCL